MLVIINMPMSNAKALYNSYVELGLDPILTLDPQNILDADHVLLPGVGAFGAAMAFLNERNLAQAIVQRGLALAPTLGVCLGLQLLMLGSEESNGTKGLGQFSSFCKKIPEGTAVVPHVGWDDVQVLQPSKLLDGIPDTFAAYFAHSYYVPIMRHQTVAKSTSNIPFSAIVESENTFGIQFHPEKTQKIGLQILRNFSLI